MKIFYRYITRFLLAISLAFMTLSMQGQAPTRDELTFVINRHINDYFPSGSWELESIKSIGPISEEGVYLVDLSPEGWILVSGDKRAEAILAYSPVGDYIIEDRGIKTPAMEWIHSYNKQIEFLKDDKGGEFSKSWLGDAGLKSAEADLSGLTIKPFITAMFNQGRGWNAACPEDVAGPDGHVLVGCVGVAIAQAISAFEYPMVGDGVHSYTHSVYGFLSVDYSDADYNWSQMSDNTPDAHNSKLLYHCAVGVDMNFGPSSSGANTAKAKNLLSTNFKFSPRINYIAKAYYSPDTWQNILNDQLLKGNPIIYRGESLDGESAHAFNIDGVRDGIYYHFNWGWGGYNNGYYLLTALTPGTRNYTTDQWAMINIKPYYYPTDIYLSNYILPKSWPIGTVVGEIGIIDEADDNQYQIKLKSDSTYIDGEWEMDYTLDGITVRTGVSFIDNPNITDTLRICVDDIYGNHIEKEIILLFGVTTESSETQDDPFNSVVLYPNPAGDYISLSAAHNFKPVVVKIYSSDGKTLISRNITSDEAIDISSLSRGIYFLEAVSAEGSSLIRKVIKN